MKQTIGRINVLGSEAQATAHCPVNGPPRIQQKGAEAK